MIINYWIIMNLFVNNYYPAYWLVMNEAQAGLPGQWSTLRFHSPQSSESVLSGLYILWVSQRYPLPLKKWTITGDFGAVGKIGKIQFFREHLVSGELEVLWYADRWSGIVRPIYIMHTSQVCPPPWLPLYLLDFLRVRSKSKKSIFKIADLPL